MRRRPGADHVGGSVVSPPDDPFRHLRQALQRCTDELVTAHAETGIHLAQGAAVAEMHRVRAEILVVLRALGEMDRTASAAAAARPAMAAA